MNKLLIVLATLPLAAGVAFASPQQDNDMQSNSMHNGMMHHKGMMHMPGFDQLDADHDGSISMGEMKMAVHSMMMDNWHKMDADNDGKISRSEYKAFKAHRMDHSDTDSMRQPGAR
ncbi:MAG TPA: EF-hand domain-containing protein [Gammaproteobacteria bacterium]|nr:EF-hand domain-containing protein [Gammaproteobacteria bacterium]